MKLSFILSIILVVGASCEDFIVGIGKTDITGPIAGWHLLGYGNIEQVGSGLKNRLFCRAFVFDNPSIKESFPIILIHTDLLCIPLRLRQEVVIELEEKYPTRISAENVLLHAQHTHSGPGGYHPATFYSMGALGFSEEHLSFLKQQIVQAVSIALDRNNQFEAFIYYEQKKLLKTGRNRSPQAFFNNIKEDVDEYLQEFGETKNTKMTILRVENKAKVTKAVLSFFAVHTTSILNTNILVNSDNKGFAEYVLETKYRDQGLVAAFFQTDLGDVSPNMLDGKDPLLFYGEGSNFIESCEAIGYRQANVVESYIEEAKTLKRENHTKLNNVLEASLRYHNFTVNGCKPMIGISMLAGTEDGIGTRLLREGMTNESVGQSIIERIKVKIAQAFLPLLLGYVSPTKSLDNDSAYNFGKSLRGTGTKFQENIKFDTCHWPKIGFIWSTDEQAIIPEHLPLQLVRIGELHLAALPFEVTSMSGQYIRKAIRKETGNKDALVEILAVTNAYASYMATGNEYDVQTYEAASTIFGRNQLDDSIDQFRKLVSTLNETHYSKKQQEIDFIQNSGSFHFSDLHRKSLGKAKPVAGKESMFSRIFPFWKPGIIYEDISLKRIESLEDLNGPLQIKFGCVHPKDSQRLIKSFCNIQRLSDTGNFDDVWNDHDWSVHYIYRPKFVFYGLCTCEWIPESTRQLFDIVAGTYRIQFNGVVAQPTDDVKFYSGYSKRFDIVNRFEKPSRAIPSFPYPTKDYVHRLPDEVLIALSLILYMLARILFYVTGFSLKYI